MTPELHQLLAELNSLRTSVLRKTDALTDADARRSTVQSGTNLAGLLQHLTFVESKWFGEIVAGRPADRGHRSMQVDGTVTLRALRSGYRSACAASDDIIAAIGDPDAEISHGGRKVLNLRAAMLSVIQETARHAGHADIIREQIDGTTGR